MLKPFRAFGRQSGEEGRAPMNGISAFIRKDTKEMTSLSCEAKVRRHPLQSRNRMEPGTESGSTLILDFPASKTENKFFFKSSSLWNFCCSSWN